MHNYFYCKSDSFLHFKTVSVVHKKKSKQKNYLYRTNKWL